MTLHNYAEIDIMDTEGRHEFHRKRIPDTMGYKDSEKFAMKFAQEWFTTIVVTEDAARKFEKENGRSLNLPKRRLMYTAVMEDHYDGASMIWQKRFDDIN